jgi:cytochrome c556
MPIGIRSCVVWLGVCIVAVCLNASASAVDRWSAKTDGRGTITMGKGVGDYQQISSRNPDFRYKRPPRPKPGSKSVKLRKALMKQNGRAMKMIFIYVRRNKGTAAQAASSARRLANNLAKLDEQFPLGTSTRDDVGRTRARPKIWVQWPQFRTALNKAKNLAKELSAAAGMGDKNILKRAMRALRRNGCSSCHRAFRARRK